MKLFSDHIPPDLLAIPNVSKFVAILDELEWEDRHTLSQIERIENPVLSTNVVNLRNMVVDLLSIPRKDLLPFSLNLLQGIAKYGDEIYKYKSTPRGYRAFGKAIFGDMRVDLSQAYPRPDVIILGDIQQGYLPNSRDLRSCPAYSGNLKEAEYEFLAPNVITSGGRRYFHPMHQKRTSFFTVIEDAILSAPRSVVKVWAVSPYFRYRDFRFLMGEFIPTLLPVDPKYTDIELRMYSRTPTGFTYMYDPAPPVERTITYTNFTVTRNPL